VPVATDKTV
jgi:hypothetical protein